MLRQLLPLVVRLRERHPSVFHFVVRIAKRFFGPTFGVYPRILADEVNAVNEVLRGSLWNMGYGRGLAHERLEADFAAATSAGHAIAVASGGVGLQMSLRALGLKPGDEAIHQVDTCSATAMAVINAGVTPIFADISERTFMLDMSALRDRIGPNTRALIATHMWGNPENMRELRQLAHEKNLNLVEDACLALGAVADGRPAGSWGDVGVFSFGNMKPIQTGEGGMIVTNDEALARELRALRHWGDRTIEFGVRDVTEVAWNGRMSEIVAAVAREQLRGYPKHLGQLRESVSEFQATLPEYTGLSLALGTAESISCSALTQVVLRIDEALLGVTKKDLMAGLTENGIPNWHANFELISSLSVFRSDHWLEWILRGDVERARQNNSGPFPVAQRVYDETGIGLRNTNFLSSGNRKYLQSVLHSLLKRTKP